MSTWNLPRCAWPLHCVQLSKFSRLSQLVRFSPCAFSIALLLASLTGCSGVTGGSSSSSGPITAVNHIIIMFQENRAFDDYFGQMTSYRQRNGIPIVSSDGKINDLSSGSFSNTVAQAGVISSYHTGSVCTEDLSPDWAETHKAMDLQNPAGASSSAPMDGFAQTAYDLGIDAQTLGVTLTDKTGRRAMGYFDDNDLNYYYFMASNFAISDAFFSPMPGRTSPNRLFIHAATSQGHAHDPTTQLTATTIWQELDGARITWKIYITDVPPGFTYLSQFTYYNQPGVQAHIFPLSQYFSDLQAGTLPSVAFIETGQFSGRDEHPSNFNPTDPTEPDHVNVQVGAQFISSIVNPLMTSSSWKNSVFFWTMDEGGCTYDHVPPMSVPSPDGIPPQDLLPTDPPGNFTITGFRIPTIVISPFSKKNYVSHTPMDYTAILKFVETRFGLNALTARDASMPDMTEFFDFSKAPWSTPPNPPAQNMNGVCDFTLE
jgi:phospholipase C